ncbi:MAG: aromatic-ring-hydroxylating dioxygenase subunit beta [Betaproteobacteria bacterium]|jgi:anthranilate 1,2-dioxygenase small subunit
MTDPQRFIARAPSPAPQTIALATELRFLYEEIADLLDRDQIEALPGYFVDDCLYQIISRENFDQGLPAATLFCDGIRMLRDRVLALRETQVYEPRTWRHFISGVCIDSIADGVISAGANVMVTEAMSDAEPTILIVGRYRDRLIRRGEQLFFVERSVVYDNYRVVRSLIAPV